MYYNGHINHCVKCEMIFDTPRSTEVQDPKIAANIQKFISMGKRNLPFVYIFKET